jgi:hypothetical protein
VLLRQRFDGFLFRKTCGTGSRSDETGSRLVHDLGARGFDTVANRKPRDIVAFTEDGDFFSFEHMQAYGV